MRLRLIRWLGYRIAAALGDLDAASPVRLKLWDLFRKFYPGHITCEQFEHFVFDYHEGVLPVDQRRRFEFHLHRCPMCESAFAAYVRSVELTGSLCEGEDNAVPADLPRELINAMLAARRDH